MSVDKEFQIEIKMQGISLTKKAGLRPALADPDGPVLSQVQPNTAQLRGVEP